MAPDEIRHERTSLHYADLPRQPHPPRNFFIFFDGTWNDEQGSKRTNVYKLYDSLEVNDYQIKCYFRGIGNDEENGLFWRLVSGTTGVGESRIRRDAYSSIALQYRPGDRLFILGFSRGAASARLLASDLNDPGLPAQIRVKRKLKHNRRTGQPEDLFVGFEASPTHERSIPVHFLGVWDTVGAFGVPIDVLGVSLTTPLGRKFENQTIAPNVRHAAHSVAIDETRDAFKPTLFNNKPSVVEEHWFAGVHSDVGGGYQTAEGALGAETFSYMVGQINAAGRCSLDHLASGAIKCNTADPLGVDFDAAELADYQAAVGNPTIHTHGYGRLKSERPAEVRYPDPPPDPPDPPANPIPSTSALGLRGRDIDWVQKRRWRRDRRWTATYDPPNIRHLP